MAQGSSGIGGFFSEKGELIDSKKLKATDETNKKQAAEKSKEAAATSTEDSQTLSRAIRSVSERTRGQVEEATRQNDSAENDVKRARAVVNEQRDKLGEIKKAEKENASAEDIQKLKDDFKEIEKRRNALADEIEKNSKERTQRGAQSIRVGNEQVARIEPRSVSLSKSNADIDSKEGLNAAIDETKESTDSLKTQRESVRAERTEIKDGLKRAREKLDGIESESEPKRTQVNIFEDATRLAQDTGNLIRQSGGRAVANNLSPDSVAKLLEA